MKTDKNRRINSPLDRTETTEEDRIDFPNINNTVMSIESDVGTRVKFLGKNGYPYELEKALLMLDTDTVYIVDSMRVGRSSSTVRLKGVKGEWNSVMFYNVDDDYDIYDWFGDSYIGD
jgi:hypothetical protein